MRKELLWLWVCFHIELKQTVSNSWYVKNYGRPQGRQNRGESWRGDWNDRSP